MRDISGRSLPLPSMRFDQDSLSWRTCEATSLWDLEMSSPSFPEWGMTVSGELFELPTPERPTAGHVSSSLPGLLKTPVASSEGRLDRPQRYWLRNDPGGRFDLEDQIAALLPTPRAQNGESRNQSIYARPLDQPQNLENALALLPTPVVNDMGSDKTIEWWEAWTKKIGGHGDSLSIEMRKLIGESTTELLEDGSEPLEDQRQIQLFPE